MVVISDVDADARVQREAQTLAEAGHQVRIIALAGTSRGGYEVMAVRSNSPFQGGGLTQRGRYLRLRRGARWLLLPYHEGSLRSTFLTAASAAAAEMDFDVVHAHDFETLALGYELARRQGARLIYDSHELWSQRIRRGRPTPLRRRRDMGVERFLGAQAHAVLTVGPDIAEWMRHMFGWNHVTVIRNSFTVAEPAAQLRQPSALLYAGRIADGRDLDAVATAASSLTVPVVMMGAGDPVVAERLERHEGIHIQPPVPIDQVAGVFQECGVGLVTASDGPMSYRLSMPNKLFQAVAAGVPVIATNLPAQARVVSDHGLGEVYRAGDALSFRRAVDRLLKDYDQARRRVVAAQPALSWDVDAERLLEVYATMGAHR